MNGIEVLIKELDPEYERCWYCKRLRHKSTMIVRDRTDHRPECIDEAECHAEYIKTELYLNIS